MSERNCRHRSEVPQHLHYQEGDGVVQMGIVQSMEETQMEQWQHLTNGNEKHLRKRPENRPLNCDKSVIDCLCVVLYVTSAVVCFILNLSAICNLSLLHVHLVQ